MYRNTVVNVVGTMWSLLFGEVVASQMQVFGERFAQEHAEEQEAVRKEVRL